MFGSTYVREKAEFSAIYEMKKTQLIWLTNVWNSSHSISVTNKTSRCFRFVPGTVDIDGLWFSPNRLINTVDRWIDIKPDGDCG